MHVYAIIYLNVLFVPVNQSINQKRGGGGGGGRSCNFVIHITFYYNTRSSQIKAMVLNESNLLM